MIETEEVQQVAGRANEQTIAFAETNLITAFQLYIINYSIKAKDSLATLVKMLLEDAKYNNHIRDRGFTLTDFLNGFGKVCLLMMLLLSYIMFMVCYVMLFSGASVQEDNGIYPFSSGYFSKVHHGPEKRKTACCEAICYSSTCWHQG
jgi:hypothetical protein